VQSLPDAVARRHGILRAQLDSILASAVFSRSPHLRRFLSFIVEQSLAEQGQTLKGLLQDGMKYFPRMLGVLLLVGVGISVVTMVIFFGMALFGPKSMLLISSRIYSFMNEYVLVSVPMFIMMASIMERSGVAKDLFKHFGFTPENVVAAVERL